MASAPVQNAVQGVSSTSVATVAEAFLWLLKSRGIDKFFINAGTDFAPLVEAYARFSDGSPLFPEVVIAGHENVSMGMAHGAYLMNGQPQAVMFHVNVGTANAVCAALNARAEGVPLLICAGRSPIYEHGKLGARNTRVAWGQEMYDQASLVREAVKWEYELRGEAQLADIVDRALIIAQSGPKGPVYLTLPREALAEPLESALPADPSVAVPSLAHPDPVAIEKLADALASAHFPVISSMASGAEPTSVAPLAELCQKYAIGYVEEQARYRNLPGSHPYHLGYAVPPVLQQADAVLFVESDVPWMDASGSPRPDAFIAQAGQDPNFSRYPVRSHRSDLAITTDARALFDALSAALSKRSHLIPTARHDRMKAMADARRQREEARRQELRQSTGAITQAEISSVLGTFLHDDCVLLNEYWCDPVLVASDRPQSYFYLPASGGLGWGIPAALGAKCAAPSKTVIAAVGDGTYMFSNPTACHHASEKHNLPVLTVVANNTRWDAVNWTSRLVYPDGNMTGRDWMAVSDLRPSPAYHEIVAASGGLGILVTERAELEDAFRRAFHAVEHEGRQALLNILCE